MPPITFSSIRPNIDQGISTHCPFGVVLIDLASQNICSKISAVKIYCSSHLKNWPWFLFNATEMGSILKMLLNVMEENRPRGCSLSQCFSNPYETIADLFVKCHSCACEVRITCCIVFTPVSHDLKALRHPLGQEMLLKPLEVLEK